MEDGELHLDVKQEEIISDEGRVYNEARLNRINSDPQWIVFGSDWNKYDIAKERLPLEVPVEKLIVLKKPLATVRQQSRGELTNSENYLYANVFKYPNIEKMIFRKLNGKLAGQVIVDLGAGTAGYGYEMATKLRACSYIAVEPYHSRSLRIGENGISHHLADPEDFGMTRSDLIPWAVVGIDMLSFLQSVDDGQISVLLGGIDDYIIDDSQYSGAVAAEIERTLATKGGVLSVGSEIYKPQFIKDGKTEFDYEHCVERTAMIDSDIFLYTKLVEHNA